MNQSPPTLSPILSPKPSSSLIGLLFGKSPPVESPTACREHDLIFSIHLALHGRHSDAHTINSHTLYLNDMNQHPKEKDQ